MVEKDDFLRELIQKSPLDSPSDNFVDRIMAYLQVAQEMAPAKKPFSLYVKIAIPYAVLVLVIFFVFATSDLPFLNWLPGKEYFFDSFLPYFGSLLTILKNTLSSKYVSMGLLIGLSAGLLFLIDRWFSHRTTV